MVICQIAVSSRSIIRLNRHPGISPVEVPSYFAGTDYAYISPGLLNLTAASIYL
jgi:hypothetical protein